MLSIDIGSKKTCIVEGSYAKDKVAITSCGEIEYKGEVVVNGEIRDRSTLSFIVNEIIKTNHMKSKSAIITISSSDIIAREMKLPNTKITNLHMLVKNEISKFIGSTDEFVIDFVVTGESSDNMLNIIAYAVSAELIEPYYSILRDSKLKPLALDISANSMAKLISNTTVNNEPIGDINMIIVDIGYSKISFHGFTSGVASFNRTELSPVQDLVRELASLGHVDSEEEMMQQLDISPNSIQESVIISETCKYFITRLADEIQKYTQYILVNSQLKTYPKIYICGGIASVNGIIPALSEALRAPVDTLNSVGRLTLPNNCSLTKVCNAAGALIRLS